MKLLFRLSLLLIFLLPSTTLKAEDLERINIDYNKIEVNVTLHPEHYRDLMKRFEKADTTLRLDEIALVYYGYPSTFDYDPWIEYDEINAAYNDKDYATALDLIEKALPYDPLNLELIVKGAISVTNLSDTKHINTLLNLQERFNMIVTVIMSSGSGLSPDEPFLVIRRNDADTVMRQVLGVTNIVNQVEAENLMAYLFYLPGSTRQNLLYFDIAPLVKMRK